ncbi:hypothetical protein GCK32_015986 [Trichostrongylus colubriformis]|uniref:Uncharacterized protein n=1 Tax=Trichostrongylus colubriformis TaxID=6319 RepID=A0AAN8FSU7_TRICO
MREQVKTITPYENKGTMWEVARGKNSGETLNLLYYWIPWAFSLSLTPPPSVIFRHISSLRLRFFCISSSLRQRDHY